MNVSIVIPVYNEADHLAACLKAISLQSVVPFEVIVVDNNSTDNSAVIASSFPFVELISERRQGVVHARNKGFDVAKGDIIGRIDADTILPQDWVSNIQKIFIDTKLSAVSGSADYYDFALESLADNIDGRIRTRLAKSLGNENFLWGANMAIRRLAWHQIKAELCTLPHIHEDFDLAIHLQKRNHRVDYVPSLIAGVSSRRVDTGFVAYVRYSLVSPRTYSHHGLTSQRSMYPVLLFCWLIYLPARVIYRIYDSETHTYQLKRLFTSVQPRIDPTSNIA